METNDFLDNIMHYIDWEYELKASSSQRGEEPYVMMTGKVKSIEYDKEYGQLLIKLEDKHTPERFTLSEIKKIEYIDSNEYKLVYGDGTYFIIYFN